VFKADDETILKQQNMEYMMSSAGGGVEKRQRWIKILGDTVHPLPPPAGDR
jgi:hypothetical protein